MGMRVIDLFCGAGGFSLGFEQAGFEILLGIDNWDLACESFKLNHPFASVWQKDIRTIAWKDLPEAEIIIGGTPCQEFTSLNLKRQPWRGMINVCHFLRLIDGAKPRYWLMENVLGLKKYLPEYLPWFKLRASDFGCQTNRYRLFVGNIPCPLHSYRNPFPRKTLVAIDERNVKVTSALYPLSDCEDLEFVGSPKDKRQLAANAVPPKLAKAIAWQLIMELKGMKGGTRE